MAQTHQVAIPSILCVDEQYGALCARTVAVCDPVIGKYTADHLEREPHPVLEFSEGSSLVACNVAQAEDRDGVAKAVGLREGEHGEQPRHWRVRDGAG